MLQKVINPGGREIEFFYDPLGRRIAKITRNKYSRFFEKGRDSITRWVWDGNVPLHEWNYTGTYTSWNRPAGKSNMSKWTNDNIRKITGNTNGRWGSKPKYQDDLMRTIRDAQAKGKLKNKLLQININKRTIKLTCK